MKSIGKDLVHKIKNARLYGEKAHAVYSPPYRPILTYEEILDRNPRFASVNILLYFKDNEWFVPLILRSKNKKDKHSGQISLPGGSKDKEDADFKATAIRETTEEIGIDKHYIKVIRELSPFYVVPSNFYVKTFVSFTKKNPQFILQESEAVELIEFPVQKILELGEKPTQKVLPASRKQQVPVIEFNGYHIWGATSMILYEFSKLLKNM